MRISPVKVEMDYDTISPSCANLALQEQPCMTVYEASQLFSLDFTEQKEGVSEDAFDLETIKDDLWDGMQRHLSMVRPQYREFVPKDKAKWMLRLSFLNSGHILARIVPRN